MTSDAPRYRLEQFEIGEKLGSGGMAVVYAGEHMRSGLPVAVKVMTSKLARVSTHRRAFLREVRSAARLSHPGIVRVFDVGEIPPDLHRQTDGELTSGAPYLVMEYVPGRTLDQLPTIQWPRVRRMVLELLDALAHAHAVGVIHRDIKPSNILLDDSGDGLVPKLTDFGIARMFDVEHLGAPFDAERKIAGTPNYMAPERVMGKWRDQGPWTDLYSLGVLVWRLVTGDYLFAGTTQQVLIAQVRDELPQFQPTIDVPERLEQWLTGMLAKSPYERFRRAPDAAVAFEQVARSAARLLPASGLDQTVDLGAPLDRADEALPTLTTVLERAPEEAYRRQAGLVTDWPRSSMPADWRATPVATVHYRRVLDAGLGLFGLRTIPIVDRDAERDQLWRSLAEALDEDATRVVHVRGPAGVGKTRLVQWFTRRAVEVGAADVLPIIHSDSSHESEGIGGMLWRLFRVDGLDEHDATVRVREQVRGMTQGRDAVAEYDAEALAQMVLQKDHDSRRSVDFVSPAERFHAIYRLLRNLTAQRAQIVWVDDAHLAIDAVRFVRFMLEDVPGDHPLLVVLSSRTEGPYQSDSLREDLEAIAAHPQSKTIALRHLDDDAMRLLVRRTLGLSPELTDQVVQQAEGTPMFAVQAVGDWVERRVLTIGSNGYELATNRVDVPDDVHALWLRRVQRIVNQAGTDADAALEALLLAALLGRWVDMEEWAVCGPPQPVLEALLEDLSRLGLADRQREGWTFAHPMMRESLLRLARSEGRWSELHRRCARCLERMHDTTTPSIALRIANHLHDCDDDVAALDVLLTAIKGAKAAHDYDWLERLLTASDRVVASLELDETDARRGLLDVTRARLLTVRNRLIDARAACEQVIDAAARHGWTMVEAEATYQLGSNALSFGHTDRAVELFQRSYDLVEPLGETLNRARAREGIGYALLHQGRYEQARPFVEEAGEVYRRLDEQRGVAFNLYHRGIIARYEDDFERARELYDECLRVASRMGFRDTLANALNALGDLDRYAGDLEAARAHYRDAFDLWTAIGAAGANVSSMNLGITMLEQGQIDEAAAILMPLAARLQRENAGMQLTFVLAATLPIYAARREEAAYDLALERFDACRASYALHDPDLDLLRDMCIARWISLGDDERVAQTRRAFGGDV